MQNKSLKSKPKNQTKNEYKNRPKAKIKTKLINPNKPLTEKKNK